MSALDGWNVVAPPRMTDAERTAAFTDPAWTAEVDRFTALLDRKGDALDAVAGRAPGGCIRQAAPALPTDDAAALLAAFETAQSRAEAAAPLDAEPCTDCDRCGGCTEAEHVPAHRPYCAAMWSCMCAYV